MRDPEKHPHLKPGIIYCPPLQLGYLAAQLIPQGFQVRIVDMRIQGVGLEEMSRIIQDERPNIVGISSTTSTYPTALAIAKLVKEIHRPTFVVMGGCHVTFTAGQCLIENPQVDAVVRGEGELTLLELAQALRENGSLTNIAGLSHRNGADDGIIHNPARPFIQNLDSLPWPSRELMELEAYNIGGALFTSRGCPHGCIFCAASAMSGRRYRIRSATQVVDEMEHLVSDYGFRHLSILDDTFTALPRRLAMPVCREILRRGLRFTFDCESRVDVVTPELCDTLVRAGCVGVQFGIESGSQAVLDASHKGITLEQARNAVRWARASGINQIVCSFILGHVHDTPQTVRQTLSFWEELKTLGVTKILFAPLTPFPGTAVYEKRDEYGLTLHESDWAKYTTYLPVVSTRHLSRKELRELYLEAAFQLTGTLTPTSD